VLNTLLLLAAVVLVVTVVVAVERVGLEQILLLCLWVLHIQLLLEQGERLGPPKPQEAEMAVILFFTSLHLLAAAAAALALPIMMVLMEGLEVAARPPAVR
jgi:hypothetical protein